MYMYVAVLMTMSGQQAILVSNGACPLIIKHAQKNMSAKKQLMLSNEMQSSPPLKQHALVIIKTIFVCPINLLMYRHYVL